MALYRCQQTATLNKSSALIHIHWVNVVIASQLFVTTRLLGYDLLTTKSTGGNWCLSLSHYNLDTGQSSTLAWTLPWWLELNTQWGTNWSGWGVGTRSPLLLLSYGGNGLMPKPPVHVGEQNMCKRQMKRFTVFYTHSHCHLTINKSECDGGPMAALSR